MKTRSIMKYQVLIVMLIQSLFVQVAQAETRAERYPVVKQRELPYYSKQFGYLLLGGGGMVVDKAYEPYASIAIGYQYRVLLCEAEISGSRMLPYKAGSRNWMPITTGNIGYNFLQIENWQLGVLGKFGALYQTYYSKAGAKVCKQHRSDFTYGISIRGEYRFNRRIGLQLESGYMRLPLYCCDENVCSKEHRNGGVYVSIRINCALNRW